MFGYVVALSAAKARSLDLVVTGAGLDKIVSEGHSLQELTSVCNVYSRVSPSQKAMIVASMKDAGAGAITLIVPYLLM